MIIHEIGEQPGFKVSFVISFGIQKPLVPRGKEDRSLRLPPPTQTGRNAYWPPFIREAP